MIVLPSSEPDGVAAWQLLPRRIACWSAARQASKGACRCRLACSSSQTSARFCLPSESRPSRWSDGVRMRTSREFRGPGMSRSDIEVKGAAFRRGETLSVRARTIPCRSRSRTMLRWESRGPHGVSWGKLGGTPETQAPSPSHGGEGWHGSQDGLLQGATQNSGVQSTGMKTRFHLPTPTCERRESMPAPIGAHTVNPIPRGSSMPSRSPAARWVSITIVIL